MTMTQFLEALRALGVTPIEAVGQKFDPNEHNAVMHMEDPEKGEGEIVQEFQKGFKMGDRVIRFQYGAGRQLISRLNISSHSL